MIAHGGLESVSVSRMMDTSSWDQTFLDDPHTTELLRVQCRMPSGSDSALAAFAVSPEGGGDPTPSWFGSVNVCRPPRRRRSLDDIVASRTSSTSDDAATPSGSALGTDLANTRRPVADRLVEGGEKYDAIRDKSSSSKCDGNVRLYANAPPPLIVGADFPLSSDDWNGSRQLRRSNLPEVTSSVAGQSSRLLFPVDVAAVRKASSSSSTSSTCDSVLELCTTSSRCSCCSVDAAATAVAAATPLGDPPSLPDSGNGSCDAVVEHFRFPRRPSSDLDRVRLSGATSNTPYCLVANFLPEWDAERLATVYGRLAQCGFYYGRLTIDAASERLRQAPVGTFLIRDSSDDRYLFSVSSQTCRGTTSIRMIYHAGLFRLDCAPDQEHLIPTFDCALRLVVHYVRSCDRRRSAGVSYVFLESSGRRDTPVLLRKPLYWRVDRLTHLCRRAVHRALTRGPSGSDPDRATLVDRLHLVPSLKCYLKDYPYEL